MSIKFLYLTEIRKNKKNLSKNERFVQNIIFKMDLNNPDIFTESNQLLIAVNL